MPNMKIVILCGGLGTRLREETEFRPKPMIEIGDKPILWHIMKTYAHYGFKDFILCLGYKGEMIKEYFYNYEIHNNDFTLELGKNKHIAIYDGHNENGWKITLAETGKDALTGARVKQIEKYVDSDTFMLTYGDGVADINIKALINYHKSHGKIGTVTGVRPQGRFGELTLKENKVEKFSEKPQAGNDFISGGFFVFERKFFQYLDSNEKCILEKEPLEKLSSQGELMVYRHEGFWQCMDTYRDYQLLNDLWKSMKVPWNVWD